MNLLNKLYIGMKCYSPIIDNCIIEDLTNDKRILITNEYNKLTLYLNKEGKYTSDGECLLFPNPAIRNWYSTVDSIYEPSNPNFVDNILVIGWCNNKDISTSHIGYYESYEKVNNIISYNIRLLDYENQSKPRYVVVNEIELLDKFLTNINYKINE